MNNIWNKFKQQCVEIFDKDKGIFFLIAIAAVIVKFRDILIDLLINSAKRVEKQAQGQDAKLAGQENDLKAQADAAVKQAAEEPSKEKPVTDDWFKKDQ